MSQSILQLGMESPEVDDLQDEMIDLGYMSLEQKNTRPGRFGPITQGAVKRFQSDNELADNGTFDIPTQAAIRQLNDEVRRGSRGGVVLPMQRRLVKAGKLRQEELNTAPGVFGEFTEGALISFQTDNLLQPNGILTDESYSLLYKIEVAEHPVGGDNAEINVLLPERGVGFRTFNRRPGGSSHFGTEFTVNALTELARVWFLAHPEVPLQYGHMSRRGGPPFPPHETHRDGRTIDMRPIRRDNALTPTTTGSSQYDKARTRELVLLLRERHPGVRILFNDGDFIEDGLTRFHPNHHNHLHVRLPG